MTCLLYAVRIEHQSLSIYLFIRLASTFIPPPFTHTQQSNNMPHTWLSTEACGKRLLQVLLLSYVSTYCVMVYSLSPSMYAQGECFLMRRNCICNSIWRMQARTFTTTFLCVLISIITVTVPATNGLFTTSYVLAGHCSTLRVARKGLAGINLTRCISSQPCITTSRQTVVS
jgi:hypothetical protein